MTQAVSTETLLSNARDKSGLHEGSAQCGKEADPAYEAMVGEKTPLCPWSQAETRNRKQQSWSSLQGDTH